MASNGCASQRTVDAATELYGLFGNPVGHSLSPLIHNTLFEHFKINAVYMAFQIEPHSLGLAFEAIRSLSIKGVNLTIPFKEDALNYIDEIPEDVDRCVGALNTVVNKGGMLYGYNTDVPGFLVSLKSDLNFNPEAKKALVLGAGGAARSVVFALARAHADKILVYNRTLDRAEGLAEYLADFFPETEIDVLMSLEDVPAEKFDLVVNASSSGMKGDESTPINLELLSQKSSVYDVVYAPLETKLLKSARKLGFPCANGLGMLAAQAALSFELWTGKRDGVLEQTLETLKKCF